MPLAFPKPHEMLRASCTVRTLPDGKEICNLKSKAGLAEYRWRIFDMVERQNGRCCLEGHISECPGRLSEEEATFEHEHGRGGGKRDDRTMLPDGTWINGAAHNYCNCAKGSRYIDYNRSFQR